MRITFHGQKDTIVWGALELAARGGWRWTKEKSVCNDGDGDDDGDVI